MKDFITLIKENAENYPERIAVIDGERKVSYADFFYLVNSISQQLVIYNSKPKVVIDLKQGIEAYALIIAVLSVGGTYCPLYIDSPIERKMQIVNEFAPDLIVVESGEKKVAFSSPKVISIENLLIDRISIALDSEYNDEDIIYVIYTSGSTGVSKGVKICRKGLNKFLEWSIPTYEAKENDIWGQFSLLSFDLSIVDIFTCLCSGATLLAMSDKTSKWVPATVIESRKITIWHSVPSVVDLIIKRQKPVDLSSLRIMSFCGEPLRKHQMDFLFENNEHLTILNTYGPTEGTLFCSWQKFEKNNYINYCDPTMSIGVPISGWNFELIQNDDSDVFEIIIYGDYIGKGYLGNIADTKFKEMVIEEKTVSAFITGDLVAKKNGSLYFLSRQDKQIKLNGFRIEPDEIDLRITEFLNKPSVTILLEDSLYSCIEITENFSEADLRTYLSKKLEAYKIPRSFIKCDKFPRSANSKIDYSALSNFIKDEQKNKEFV